MDEDQGYWLSGIIDARGHFYLHKDGCRFRLYGSSDLLIEMNEILPFGVFYPKQWSIHNKKDCVSLVSILNQYPLRTHKNDQFYVWRRAVSFWISEEDPIEKKWALDHLRLKLRELSA